MAQDRSVKRSEATELDLGAGFGSGGRRLGEGHSFPVLRVLAGASVMDFCVLHPRKATSIGRDEECGLTIEDGSVSRVHAEVRYLLPASLMLEDKGSTNGTRYGGKFLAGATPIQAGGEILVGNVPVRVELLSYDELAHLSDIVARLHDSQTDPLTGLLVRRHLDAVVPHQVALLESSRMPISIVLLDLKNLDSIRERLGRPVAEAALRVVGRLLRETVRLQDRAIRYSASRMAVVMPNATEEGAVVLAQRIVDTLVRHDWSRTLNPTGKAPPELATVDLLAAAAELVPDEQLPSWLNRAERTLYVAQQVGQRVMPASSVA